MRLVSEREFLSLPANHALRPACLSSTRWSPSSSPRPVTTTTKSATTTTTITTTPTTRMTSSNQTSAWENWRAAKWSPDPRAAVEARATGTSVRTRPPRSPVAPLWPRRGRPSTRPMSSFTQGSPTLPSNARPDPLIEQWIGKLE